MASESGISKASCHVLTVSDWSPPRTSAIVSTVARTTLFSGCRWLNVEPHVPANQRDRKSTRLNSSHLVISYAVFCLKKKKKNKKNIKPKNNNKKKKKKK